jgi:outer membrane protein TolC
MNRHILATCFFGFFIFSQTAHSQALITHTDALALALRNNYGILLAKTDSVAGAIDAGYTYGAFLPRVNAVFGTVWNNNTQQQKFQDGTQRGPNNVKSNNLAGSLNLDWVLFDGLRMFATKERIEEIASLGELGIKVQVVNTVAEVTTTYFSIVREKQQLKAIEEQMSVSDERVKVADRKLSTGLGSKPELLQAQVDLNAQKSRQLQQLTLIAQLKEQLNQVCGNGLPTEFEVEEEIPFNPGLQLENIQSDIASTNPSLLLAERNIGVAQLSLKEVKANRYPTLSFNSAYNYNRNDNQTVVNPFQPLISRSNGFNYGFTANIPILNNRLVERNIEQAQLDIAYLQLAYADQKLQVDVSLKNAFRDYVYQKQALQLEEENIELAKENVAIALERFRQGVSTYLELREAQKSLEDAYNRLIAARYNAKLAETELLRLKGELVR